MSWCRSEFHSRGFWHLNHLNSRSGLGVATFLSFLMPYHMILAGYSTRTGCSCAHVEPWIWTALRGYKTETPAASLTVHLKIWLVINLWANTLESLFGDPTRAIASLDSSYFIMFLFSWYTISICAYFIILDIFWWHGDVPRSEDPQLPWLFQWRSTTG